LKRLFTVNVAIDKNHYLKTDGIYKKIRHPGYLGLILIVTGLSVSMNSLFSILVITIPICLAVSYRIYIEENMLAEEFGEKYYEYKSSSKRLIPWIY
jgi:protein-S-isoprenylcysteine O-methyltransferase Ste14